jgi:hypothetical protein
MSALPPKATLEAVCSTKEKGRLVASLRAAFKSGKGWDGGESNALAPYATYIVTPRDDPKGPIPFSGEQDVYS